MLHYIPQIAKGGDLADEVVVVTRLKGHIVGVEDAVVRRQKVAVVEFNQKVPQRGRRPWHRL